METKEESQNSPSEEVIQLLADILLAAEQAIAELEEENE